jgi:hypothetical protein
MEKSKLLLSQYNFENLKAAWTQILNLKPSHLHKVLKVGKSTKTYSS